MDQLALKVNTAVTVASSPWTGVVIGHCDDGRALIRIDCGNNAGICHTFHDSRSLVVDRASVAPPGDDANGSALWWSSLSESRRAALIEHLWVKHAKSPARHKSH